MQNDLDDISNQWKKAKGSLRNEINVDALVKTAETKRKASLAFHYGNMIVLACVVIMLVWCFIFLFPFRETISRIGVAIMVGGLVVRIVIEYYSVIKSKAIDLSASALANTERALSFYNFRKQIHGRITITIVALYCAGLGMLTGEFYKYIGSMIFVFDAMFCLSGIFIVWQVRKGIKKEMNDLAEIMKIKAQITE